MDHRQSFNLDIPIDTMDALQNLVERRVCDTAEKVCFFTLQFEPDEAIGNQSQPGSFQHIDMFRIHQDLPSEADELNVTVTIYRHLEGDPQAKIPGVSENKSDHHQLTDRPTETEGLGSQ